MNFRSETDNGGALQRQAEQNALTYASNLTPAQRAYIANPYPAANMPLDAQGNATFSLPYPGAPHDGGPQDLANTQAISGQGGQAASAQAAYDSRPGFWDKLIPALAIGMASAGVGSGVGGAIGDVTGSATAGGVAGGATAGGLASAVQGRNPTTGALVGGLTGGVGASGLGQQATGALTGAGFNPALASGLVRGGIGAGFGALGGALSGQGPANGALTGGIGGAASGLVGSAADSQGLGNIAGIIGGSLANKYLGSSPGPHVSDAPPNTSVSPGTIPTLPSGPPSMSQAGGPSNVGAYSGYSGLGYQPRQQANMSGTDWANYGQGPEQQFFKPVGT